MDKQPKLRKRTKRSYWVNSKKEVCACVHTCVKVLDVYTYTHINTPSHLEYGNKGKYIVISITLKVLTDRQLIREASSIMEK